MKRNGLIIATVIIIALIGLVLIFSSSKNPQPISSDTTTQDSSSINGEETLSQNGRYIVYSPENLETAKNTKRVLFFYANWCPICRPADADFKANANQIPDGVTLIRVNYNDSDTDQNEQALAQKYGITYQHTFVQIDTDGNPITKWSGGQTKELLTNLK